MRKYNEESFTQMSWKNGGGSTLELICIKDMNNEVKFRLSSAQVKTDGPFSTFSHLDRILMLTKGNGFKLHFPSQKLLINSIHSPVSFAGEEEVLCHLIDGDCEDFNVMTNRHFGKSYLSIKMLKPHQTIIAQSDQTFLYLPQKKSLYQMNLDETFHSDDKECLVYQIDLDLI